MKQSQSGGLAKSSSTSSPRGFAPKTPKGKNRANRTCANWHSRVAGASAKPHVSRRERLKNLSLNVYIPYNDRSALLLKTNLRYRLTLAPTPGQYQALVAHVTDSLCSTVHSGSTHLGQIIIDDSGLYMLMTVASVLVGKTRYCRWKLL